MTVKNHFLREISPFQRKKIEELKKAAADDLLAYPEYNSDFSLLRWLLGYDYNLDAILPKLRQSVITLTGLELGDLEINSVDEINGRIRRMSSVATYFPGGIMGQDSEGNVIYVQAFSHLQPRSLVRAGAVSELFRLSITEIELCFKIVRKAEEKRGKKLGVKIIVDLEGFTMDLMYQPTLKIYKTLIQLLQDTFPDFARSIYIINPPALIKTVYELISPILARQTKEKVHFLGRNWKEVLLADLGTQNVLPAWGGTKKHNCPTGDVRMGGKLPEDLLYDPKDDLQDVEYLKVPAKREERVTIRGEKGRSLRWWWRVSSGDLDFWITTEEGGFFVWPKFRLSTEFYPESGRILCRETGNLILHFDNSHGSLWSKDVRHKIWIE